MIILSIKTDRPEAELAVFEGNKKLAEQKWPTHRTLADTINSEIERLLRKSNISLSDLEGIVCFQGPGSFTGLRIGLSVGNALAYAQNIPILATRGRDWLEQGIKKLQAGQNQKIVAPFYDRPANITKPKK